MPDYIKMKDYMEKYHTKNPNVCAINPPNYASDSTRLLIEACRSQTEKKDVLYYDKTVELRTNRSP